MDNWGSLIQALMNTGGLPQMFTAPTQSGALGEYKGGEHTGFHFIGRDGPTEPVINIKPGIPAHMQAPVQRHEQAHALMDRVMPDPAHFPIDRAIAKRQGAIPQGFDAMTEHFARFIEGQPQVSNDPLLFMLMRHLSDQIFRESMGATPAK